MNRFRKKNNDNRKMSKIEKKQYKLLERAKKDTLALKKKASTTLSWMDIQDVTEDHIILSRNNRIKYVTGVKVAAHNILLDRPEVQIILHRKLEIALNQLEKEFWVECIQSRVNCDRWINQLEDKSRIETNAVIRNMITSDLNKIHAFQNTHREKAFYVLIQGSDLKELEKNLMDLESNLESANLHPKRLSEMDYYAYIAYAFDNILINDYVFSRGVFSYMNTFMPYNKEKDRYEMVNHHADFTTLGDIGINAIPPMNHIKRTKLAPMSLIVNDHYMQISDKYSTFLLTVKLPEVFELGLLSKFLDNPNIKIHQRFSPSHEPLSAILNRAYRQISDQLDHSKDETEKKNLIKTLESLHSYIDDVIRSGDKTYNVTLIFQVCGNTVKEMTELKLDLKNYLTSSGFKMMDGSMMQEQLFRTGVPLFIDDKLPYIIRRNYSMPLTSDGVAGLYPFIFDEMNDQYGYLLAEEMQNQGKIFFDPFYYLNEHEEASLNGRVNGNTIVIGKSGSGKTTTMNLLIRNFIRNKVSVVWVDPENKNAQLTNLYRGTYIEWGKPDYLINVFDLKPNSSEDDETDEYKYDTRIAINAVIEDVCQLFKLLYPKISDNETALIGPIIYMTYDRVGIKQDEDGKYASFRSLTPRQMPTFEDFNECLMQTIEHFRDDHTRQREVDALNELSIKMYRIMNEWSAYFVGHTNIDLVSGERNIVSFGTKRLFNLPDEEQNALYFLMFKYSWTLCLDETIRSAFVIDEAHSLILKSGSARLVEQFVRRSRKYKNAMLIGTQEARDFCDDSVLTQGKAIFNNSIYKIAMSMPPDTVNELKKLENLNENEQMFLSEFTQGQALFMIGSKRRIPINVLATKAELDEMGAMYTQ